MFGGNTVNLSGVNFTGNSKVGLYSVNGVLNTNGTVIPGDVNFISGDTYNGTNASALVGMSIHVGMTADNPTVQAALGTAVTLGSSPPSPSQIFANVLFTPEETGGSVGDGYFFVGYGLFGGAITANGEANLTGVPQTNSFSIPQKVDIAAYNGFNITGNTFFDVPSISNNTGLRLFSRLGFTIAPGSVITNGLGFSIGNNSFAFEMDSLPSTTFNNVSILSPNSSVNVGSAEGSLTFNGGVINAGNGGTGGVNLVAQGGEQAVTVAGATITGNSVGFIANDQVTIQADNVTVSSNASISAGVVNLVGGTIGVTVTNSSSTSSGPVNVTSGTDISIANSTLTSSSTPPGSSFTAGRVNLTAVHVVTVVNSTLVTPRPVILAGSAINLNGVDVGSATNVDMQARTINLSNINFPSLSTVNLTSQNGKLAPNPNTNAASVVGDVNFITNVMYGGAPAQNFVPVSVGGKYSSSLTNRININSATIHPGVL